MAFTDDEILSYLKASRAAQGLTVKLTAKEEGWLTEGYGSGAFDLVEDDAPEVFGFLTAA